MPRPPSRNATQARLSDADLPPLDQTLPPWPVHETVVGTSRIAVRRTPSTRPDAEPALFVHGLGGSSTNWTDLAAQLRDRLAIEAIDLPGHGRSGPARDGRYTIESFVRIVTAYLESTGRGPVHLVGNSMGGLVSVLVAARRPDLVRTLTLVSPAVPDNQPRVYALRYDWRMAVLAVPALGGVAMKRMAGLPPEVRAKGTIKICFADPSRYPATRLAESVDEVRARGHQPWASRAFLASMRGLVGAQVRHGRAIWSAMGRITAPTLVIWGESDHLVAPDLAPYVAARIPDARLLQLPDIGHVAMMEDPVTTARAVTALLEDVVPARPTVVDTPVDTPADSAAGTSAAAPAAPAGESAGPDASSAARPRTRAAAKRTAAKRTATTATKRAATTPTAAKRAATTQAASTPRAATRTTRKRTAATPTPPNVPTPPNAPTDTAPTPSADPAADTAADQSAAPVPEAG